ncbi:MAG TPA: AAA family ATPase [Thermodesulfobacteriota bacterium]|nr:AAA family ATPase [Deltaproteobacteria bacterium]HNR14176.1 AAA family ATPase [Thermodesulfobacteriota bacterium]
MGYKIAISGKGGTGKTTLAGFIIGYLLRKGRTPVLAVDADANANFNEVLGVSFDHTIGGMREKLRTEVPPGMSKHVWFEMKAQEALVETKDFDLLVMGRPEGAGCYCVANALAREFIDVLTKNYQYVVIDNEAGMEHFSRLTTHDVDLLLIVSDSSIRGLHAVRRILDLIAELNLRVGRSVVLVNQVKVAVEPAFMVEASSLGIHLAGFVPFDEAVAQLDKEGKPTYDLDAESSSAVRMIETILDELIKE